MNNLKKFLVNCTFWISLKLLRRFSRPKHRSIASFGVTVRRSAYKCYPEIATSISSSIYSPIKNINMQIEIRRLKREHFRSCIRKQQLEALFRTARAKYIQQSDHLSDVESSKDSVLVPKFLQCLESSLECFPRERITQLTCRVLEYVKATHNQIESATSVFFHVISSYEIEP